MIGAAATLMRLRVTDADDVALAALIGDGAVDFPVNPARAEVVVIGEEEGAPVGFCCGWIQGEQAILAHLGIRPGFRGQHRARLLADAFVGAMLARGHRYVVTALDPEAPETPWMRILLARWPAQPYAATDDGLTWYVHYPEDT